MSNQIFKIPHWNQWNGKYTPKSPKYPKNYKMSKKKTLLNLLIDQNSLKISKTTCDGLSTEFDAFNSALRTRSDIHSIKELNTFLKYRRKSHKEEIWIRIFESNTLAMAINSQSEGFFLGKGRRPHRGLGGITNFSGHGGYNPNQNQSLSYD